MPFKKHLPKIFLVLGFLALFLIIAYRSQIQEIWLFNLGKLKTHKDNFFYETSPGEKRQRPVTLLQKETELQAYAGEPFISFTREEWEEFWDLIYGARPIGAPEKEGLPKKMRQLTQDEIAFELMNLYPQPFAYFKEEQWRIFFGIIFKK